MVVCVAWIGGMWRGYAADRVVWDMVAVRLLIIRLRRGVPPFFLLPFPSRRGAGRSVTRRQTCRIDCIQRTPSSPRAAPSHTAAPRDTPRHSGLQVLHDEVHQVPHEIRQRNPASYADAVELASVSNIFSLTIGPSPRVPFGERASHNCSLIGQY